MSETDKILKHIESLWNTGKGKQLDELGREVLDPRPVAPPIGFVKQPTMVEMIRNMVKGELLKKAAADAGAETFEEADDFDTGEDDDDPRTPYEAVFEPPATPLPGEPAVPAPDPPKPPETPPQAGGTPT